jgi:hypothetical protein
MLLAHARKLERVLLKSEAMEGPEIRVGPPDPQSSLERR